MSLFIPINFENTAAKSADSLGGFAEGATHTGVDGRPTGEPDSPKGNDDRYDAYRHALLSAKLAEAYGDTNARAITDSHEGLVPNSELGQNMDRWNNDVGIEAYHEWKDSDGSKTLEKWIYDKVQQGETINNGLDQSEQRKFDGPPIQPTTWSDDKALQFKIFFSDLFNGHPEEVIDIPKNIQEEVTRRIISEFFDDNYIGDNGHECIANIKNLFETAEITKSPIALDLNGDGITTTAKNSGAYFDHDNNGFAEQTGWGNRSRYFPVHNSYRS